MAGDRVVVRGFRGEARILRLLRVHGGVAQLTDEEGFGATQQGEAPPRVVMFRLSDVFLDDGTIAHRSFPAWEKAVPYAK